MADKIFCGSGKIVQTKFGLMTKISFSKKDLETMMANLSEKGWINTVLKEKQNKTEGKPTHYLEVDTWKSEDKGAYVPTAQPMGNPVSNQDDENLPF